MTKDEIKERITAFICQFIQNVDIPDDEDLFASGRKDKRKGERGE